MEKILIAYSQDSRKLASRIQQVLSNCGFQSTLGATSINPASGVPEVVIAVTSNDFISDQDMMKLMGQCSEHAINVVLWLGEKIGKTVANNFFLDEHVWIDNVGQPFEEAARDLDDLLKNNYPELRKKALSNKDQFGKVTGAKPRQKNPSSSNPKNNGAKQPAQGEKMYRNLFFVSLAVVAVMLLILISGGRNNTNREAQRQMANTQNALQNTNIQIQLSNDLRKSETLLVGSWILQDYQDNMYRPSHDDTLQYRQNVEALLQRGSIVFRNDKTFSRMGFSDQTENGTWEYDGDSKYLKLKPNNVNQYDVVQVQQVDNNVLILVVQETVESSQIISKMTFRKN